MAGSISTIGSRRRAAAIASPSRVCAFSRARSSSRSAWKAARPTTAGIPGVAAAGGWPGFSGSLCMIASLACPASYPCGGSASSYESCHRHHAYGAVWG